jgi:omega-amidase
MSKPADTLLVTLVQSALHWEDKEANLAMLEKQINSVTGRMELVVLPEMFNTGFSMNPVKLAETMEGPTVSWMRKICAEKKIILTGSAIIKKNENYFNRLIWMLPTGEYGFYDKRHLFAYAGENAQFSSGKKRLIASVKGWKINLLVCYDLRFPVWARQSVPVSALPDGSFIKSADQKTEGPEYDVLVYVANWPDKRSHAWKTLLQARAIENQCYVIGVNRVGTDGNNHLYSGDSMVVDPMGEVLQTVSGHEAIFTYPLTLEKITSVRERLPFLDDADPFIIGS